MNPLTILLVIAGYFALLFFISYLAGRKADLQGGVVMGKGKEKNKQLIFQML